MNGPVSRWNRRRDDDMSTSIFPVLAGGCGLAILEAISVGVIVFLFTWVALDVVIPTVVDVVLDTIEAREAGK